MAAVEVDRDPQGHQQKEPGDGVDQGPDVALGVVDAAADGGGEVVAFDLFAGQTLVHQIKLQNFWNGRGTAGTGWPL
jgi:hypothetical protein